MGYKKIEDYDEEYTKSLSSNYKEVIENLDEDPNREGLLKTPERVAKAMQMRGVQKQNSTTTTSAFSGVFMKEDITRQEFMSLVKGLTR